MNKRKKAKNCNCILKKFSVKILTYLNKIINQKYRVKNRLVYVKKLKMISKK